MTFSPVAESLIPAGPDHAMVMVALLFDAVIVNSFTSLPGEGHELFAISWRSYVVCGTYQIHTVSSGPAVPADLLPVVRSLFAAKAPPKKLLKVEPPG